MERALTRTHARAHSTTVAALLSSLAAWETMGEELFLGNHFTDFPQSPLLHARCVL